EGKQSANSEDDAKGKTAETDARVVEGVECRHEGIDVGRPPVGEAVAKVHLHLSHGFLGHHVFGERREGAPLAREEGGEEEPSVEDHKSQTEVAIVEQL